MDLRALVELYCSSHLGTPAYRADLRRSVRYFCAATDITDSFELNVAGLYTFIAHASTERNWSPSTTNDYLALIAILWRFAAEIGAAPPPPGRLPKLRTEAPHPQAWTLEEVEQLLAAAARLPGTVGPIPAGDWWPAMLLTIYWTSSRVGALLAAEPQDYLPANGILILRKTKNRRPQAISLHHQAREAINKIYRQDLPRLFWWPYGRRWFYVRLRRLAESAGLSVPRTGRQLTHRLRRTALTLCWRENPSVAQQLAGHASSKTTLRHYIDLRFLNTNPPPLPVLQF